MEKYKNVEYVPVDQILDHPDVPNIRTDINKADVAELMRSIKDQGISNPLTCFVQDGKYFLVSGWRRKRAVEELCKSDPKFSTEVPVLVRNYDNGNTIQQALVENISENVNRRDVNPMDLADRINILINAGSGKQELCQKLGKSITWLNNVLSVLDADPEVQKSVRAGEITMQEATQTAKLPREAQATVAKGLGAVKKSGDKKARKAMKEKLQEVVSDKIAMPTKKEIKYNRNVIQEIVREMKTRKEEETEEYRIFQGALHTFNWCLGENTRAMNIDKLCKKYGIEIGNDGMRLKPKKEKNPKTEKKTEKSEE